MSEEQPEFWAIVELLGHRTLAGRLSVEKRFGATMGRLDVPMGGDPEKWTTVWLVATRYLMITACTEAIARAKAKNNQPKPLYADRSYADRSHDDDEGSADEQPRQEVPQVPERWRFSAPRRVEFRYPSRLQPERDSGPSPPTSLAQGSAGQGPAQGWQESCTNHPQAESEAPMSQPLGMFRFQGPIGLEGIEVTDISAFTPFNSIPGHPEPKTLSTIWKKRGTFEYSTEDAVVLMDRYDQQLKESKDNPADERLLQENADLRRQLIDARQNL